MNISTTNNNRFYSAIRRINYEILKAKALVEGQAVADAFAYLEPDEGSTNKTTEQRKGEVVQMFLNVRCAGTLLAGVAPSMDNCEICIPEKGGDFTDWVNFQ